MILTGSSGSLIGSGTIALALLLWTTSSLCAQTLTIRLYDYSGFEEKTLTRVTEVVNVVYGHAGSRVAWMHCRGAIATVNPDVRCQTELADDIIVRLHPLNLKSQNRRDVAMAWAFVQKLRGHSVTVFVPAVRSMKEDLEVGFELLLGYTIVHETVHCIAGPAHSAVGV